VVIDFAVMSQPHYTRKFARSRLQELPRIYAYQICAVCSKAWS